jgi:hypothetical protein
MFLPDPNQPSTWVLLFCLVCAGLAAFGPNRLRNSLIKMADYLVMVPWILFSGMAAEHTNFIAAMAGLDPKELLDHPVYDFYFFIPIAGVSIVLISTLLWIGTKRDPGNGPSIRLLPHLVPGILLILHALNASRFYSNILEDRTFDFEFKSFESGLDTNIALIALLFSCGLLAYGFIKLEFSRTAP